MDHDLSELSNRSFLTSLGDEELIDLINNLSQTRTRHAASQQNVTQLLDVPDTEEETDNDDVVQSPVLPESVSLLQNQLVVHSDESLQFQESTLSLPLAQAQPQEQGADAEGGPDNIIFGDYRTYFNAKAVNQQQEDERYLEWDRQRREVQGLDAQHSKVFDGCVIYVNGHTRPSIATIHKLVILHGGKFLHFLGSKGAATHIIASRLTPKKKLEFKNYKVVKPEWILESIEKGKLQKWSDYSVIDPEYGQGQLQFAAKEAVEEPETGTENELDAGENDEETELQPLTQVEEPDASQTEEYTITIDSKHPDFLKTFFAKSRLHHLSTWKADLRAEFLAKALEQAKSTQRNRHRGSSKLIMHVDFDCFFATASALNHPEIDFKNTPVCVSHGGSKASSTADVASCNYVCRKYGVRNGMWVRSARKLCPDLVCLDYDFPTYERISKEFYQVLLDLKPDCILPVSIDEALLEITSFINEDDTVNEVNAFAEKLKAEIFARTKCTASAGVSSNVLLAKLSLRKAKPDGIFYLHERVQEFLDEINVRDLPGAGGSIEQKLVNELFPFDPDKSPTVKDVRTLEKSKLEKLFGVKTGQKLFDYARGMDNTSIDIGKNPEQFMRKSVSIDINWGIRFDEISQIDDFLLNVGKELSLKLKKINMAASSVTLKLLKRSKGAPVDPPKYLGCGKCDAFTKSSRLGIATDDFRTIGTEARALFRHIGCDPKELRGVSIQVTKLSEKKKDTQKRLPFDKVDFETFKKRKLKEKRDLKLQEEELEERANVTQYDIPTDVDSSILNQLPESVQTKIRNQRNRDLEPVSMIPKEVDREVFNQLPPEIQLELQEELRRRNIPIEPRTPSKNRRVYLQQVFSTDGQAEFVRVVSPRKSPSKRTLKSPRRSPERLPPAPPRPALALEDLDEDVLNELPSSVREHILEEWQEYERATKTKYAKIKEKVPVLKHGEASGELYLADFVRLSEPLEFQKRSRPKEVLRLVDDWIVKTKRKGPHVRDLELFEEFMNGLLRYNRVFYFSVVRTMRIVLDTESDVCGRWIGVVEKLDLTTKGKQGENTE